MGTKPAFYEEREEIIVAGDPIMRALVDAAKGATVIVVDGLGDLVKPNIGGRPRRASPWPWEEYDPPLKRSTYYRWKRLGRLP